MFDTLIRHGRVVDGTRSPWFPADVGLLDGRIAAVGRLDGAIAGKDIDASGLVVAPGFVDIHDHSDFTLVAGPSALSAIHQGVTTLVPGNCGFSAAPIADLAAQKRALYGFVEGLVVSWHTFGDYLGILRGARTSVNVAPLVGHGAIRSAAVGFSTAPARGENLAAMKRLLRQSLAAGCNQFSRMLAG
jgi:N-acyl-D-aspartate/D-glutamate deacylase